MKSILTALLAIFTCTLHSQLQSPDEFLPHKLGEHFTPHHYLVDYYRHAAANSPLVRVHQYGVTNLKKPLITAFVSSEENLANLENIRRFNLKQAGIEENDIQLSKDITIVWLSFSVHGNEAAGSESSYQVLFELADPDNQRTKAWLENTVVILDPSINPDGYSRYTHWVRNFSGFSPNSDPADIEHQEPWPGGRTNFYFFDLNRDWAWQTQVESRQRMALYNQWLPHVHADLHEMGYTSPYYFAPAAQPYHEYITQWQRDFQFDIGRNHAKYFDEEGWLFFTREVFDLFYPSYGDTYPTYTGAIGMTYEQGGGGRGGRSIEMPNGEFLTLTDRIAHHRTTALSTVEVSSNNAGRLVQNFREFYTESAAQPPGSYLAYVIKPDKTHQRISELAELLDLQGVQYGTVPGSANQSGYSYTDGAKVDFSIDPGDLVVNARQPKAILAKVLLDPESHLVDSLTYDITSWSLPFAYGLEAYALEAGIDNSRPFTIGTKNKNINPAAVAFAFEWGSLTHARALAKIYSKGISARVLLQDGIYAGVEIAAGSIVVTRADNKISHPELGRDISEYLGDLDIEIKSIMSGFSDEGPDLGSRSVSLIEEPKILVVTGEGVSSYDYGQIKYFFEQNLGMTITSVNKDDLNNIDLDDYSVLILPSGRYNFSDSRESEIKSWIRGGGKVVALGYALNTFADREGFALKRYATDEEKSTAEKAQQEEELASRLESYEGEARRRISEYIPGAVIKLKLDKSHPLSFGIDKDYFSLKTGTQNFALMQDGWNVGYIPKDPVVSGFIGSGIRDEVEETVIFGVDQLGGGAIIYMVDNPLFRGFWNIGQVLFANAVFWGEK